MKKKKKGKPQGTARRSMLDPAKWEHMLAVLIRNPDAVAAVRDLLTPGKLLAADRGLAVVWTVVRDYHEQHGKLPKRGLLLTEVQDALGADPDLLTEEEVENVQEFLDFAFDKDHHGENLATSETQADWAVKTARKFLDDQLALKVQEEIHDRGKLPADLPAMLRAVTQEADEIAGLQTKGAGVPFPAGWDKVPSPKLFPTGISAFDRFLGGGHKGGESYLFMGPFGSCKTCVAVMGLVEGARQAAARTAEPGWDGRESLSVLVSYETPVDELRERCLSYAASIPRDRAERVVSGGKGLGSLSASGKLLKYEKALFKAKLLAGETVRCERERAEEAVELLNRHAVFTDMTGADPQRPGAGNGYVPEVARALENELRQRQNAYLLVVWLDYLGAMAKRHVEASERDYGDLRHLVSGGVLHLTAQVAMPFQCPVWVTHQLSGAANARGPTARVHHTDGAEAKNVAENASFAVVTGTLTGDQLCVFDCTKHRRQPPRAHAVVRVDGRFNRVVDVSNKYVVDRDRRAILSKEEYESPVYSSAALFTKQAAKANYTPLSDI